MHPVLRLLACAAALAALGACETPADLGDAVSRNAAAHVIDPEPARAQDTLFGFGGDRAALAIARYKTDKVKPPRELRTSAVGDSGGGGGGGGQ